VLTIKQIPQWADHGTVELRGEVRFPGTYPIRPGETLSQVIERAGGLTESADRPGLDRTTPARASAVGTEVDAERPVQWTRPAETVGL
jgi:protein involved in polysaccharide export with SLBB domain